MIFRAPDDCLQYYTGSSGEFKSFNFANGKKKTEIPHCVRKNTMKKSFIMGNFLSAFLSNNMGKWSRSFKKTERTYFSRFLKFPILQDFNNFMWQDALSKRDRAKAARENWLKNFPHIVGTEGLREVLRILFC